MVVRTIIGVVVIAFCATTGAFASPVIDVGNILLPPGEISTFSIDVTGGGAIQGVNFYIQIGDGGDDNGGTDTKPIITALDIVGPGTLFNGISNAQSTDSTANDLIWFADTTVLAAVGTTEANGLLAYVTVDTAGTAAGEVYDLFLTGVAAAIFSSSGKDTDFTGVSADITNGTITITPEPATLSLLALGGLALMGRRRRKA